MATPNCSLPRLQGEWPGCNIILRTGTNPPLPTTAPSDVWRNCGAEGQGSICTLHFISSVYKSGGSGVEVWEGFFCGLVEKYNVHCFCRALGDSQQEFRSLWTRVVEALKGEY